MGRDRVRVAFEILRDRERERRKGDTTCEAWGQCEKETFSEIQWRTISRWKPRYGGGEESNRESVGWKIKHVIYRRCYMIIVAIDCRLFKSSDA